MSVFLNKKCIWNLAALEVGESNSRLRGCWYESGWKNGHFLSSPLSHRAFEQGCQCPGCFLGTALWQPAALVGLVKVNYQ